MKARVIALLICLFLIPPAQAGFFSTFFANVASDAISGGGGSGGNGNKGSDSGPKVDPLLTEKKIQSALGVMAFYNGELSGDLDTFESRTGIKAFQTAFGHESSGILTNEQLRHLTYLSNLFVEVSKPDINIERKTGIWQEIDATKEAMRVKSFSDEYLSFLQTTTYPLRIATEFDNGEITLTGNGLSETLPVQLKYVQFNLPAGENQLSYQRLSDDEEFFYSYETSVNVAEETNLDVIAANKAETQKRLDRLAAEAEKAAKAKAAKEAKYQAMVKNLKSGNATEDDWWLLASYHERWKNYKPKSDSPTFVDPMTGLEWARCSLGQTWTGKACTGTTGEYKWNAAKQQASDSTYAGKSDWRLPTIDELHSIVYCSSGQRQAVKRKSSGYSAKDSSGAGMDGYCEGSYSKPTISNVIFPNTPGYYFWSGSPDAFNSNRSWVVGFNRGDDGYGSRDSSAHVRLVRSSK